MFQFQKPPPKVPYKAIMLAAVLFIVGSALIIVGAMLLAGYIDTKVRTNKRTHQGSTCRQSAQGGSMYIRWEVLGGSMNILQEVLGRSMNILQEVLGGSIYISQEVLGVSMNIP